MAERYIPALRHAWLTGLYDPVLRATMREAASKSRLSLYSGEHPR